jgi:nucleoside-diphosphate-sugar epimerase
LSEFATKRLLVTGGYGFVGRHLLRELAPRCTRLAVLSRSPPAGSGGEILPPHDFIRGELAAADATVAQIRRFAPDLIFHLAAWPDQAESLDQTRHCVDTNLRGTLHVLEGARQTGAGVIVGDSVKSYGNSSEAYSAETPEAPNSSYAITKVAAWHTAKLYSHLHGIAVSCVRPTLIYGPGQGFNLFEFVLKCLGEDRPEIRLKGGSQTRDPLFIDDAVSAYTAVGARIKALCGQVINIGGGREHTAVEIAEAVVRATGAKTAVVADPSDSRPTEIWRSRCDNARARDLLGWEPRVDLQQGIALMLDARRKVQQQLKIA